MTLVLTFNPSKLKLARSRRFFTIKKLAEAVNMTSRMISNYENGRNDIPQDTLERIANVLDYPESFFKGDDLEDLDPQWVSFRSMKGMSAAKRDAALGSGTIAILFNSWIDEQFQLPYANLCDLRDSTPTNAARTVREKWGIGEQSITNVIHLLEANGVRVFSLSESYKEIDAYSFWKNETPFIFLNTFKSAERSRFDAAHELGHLILHKHGGPRGREAEQEADKFASSFLMPSASVIANAPQFASIQNLIKLKKIWLVSLSSLVRRLKDLSLISEWQYRSLNIEMSKRGMLRTEPESINRETSLIFGKIFRALKEDGVTKKDIARQLCLPSQEIDNLIFNLAFIGATVKDTGASFKETTTKPNLKLIKS